MKSLSLGLSLAVFISIAPKRLHSSWHQAESQHFLVIYHEQHAHLVQQILTSAELAFVSLVNIFGHAPAERIVIHTNDFSDYGSAGATTVPHNFIRLEIEPLELGYENILYKQRLQWLLAHELVHIFVNDYESGAEKVTRSLFAKVPPEKTQPLSILFSLLTNSRRYSPRWHQEGIAVFMETWLNDGFGRVLGNFDEMYFRALVAEGKPFASFAALDAQEKETSFLLETLSYLYGARFNAYLAHRFGPEKLISWYGRSRGIFSGFEGEFKSVFQLPLKQAWRDFSKAEQEFQAENLRRLQSAPLTEVSPLVAQPLGWVTQAYLTEARKIVFVNHRAHYLTSVNLLDTGSKEMTQIGSVPTPSLIQLASTAYDDRRRLFFYTTNNNQLYRDTWVLDLNSGHKKVLFKDSRAGHLAVCSKTGELWGVRHSGGKAHLVYASYPYKELKTLVAFEVGDELQHLAVSPSGRFLAATLHQTQGTQSIISVSTDEIKRAGTFKFRSITKEGSPEFPSWSSDEGYIYWNAFTNGVSNIYRFHHAQGQVEAMSHTLRGLFRPLVLNSDSLFVFEFTSDGFVPAIIPNKPAKSLTAIRYYGQDIIERAPHVKSWGIQDTSTSRIPVANGGNPKGYSALSHVRLNSVFPVISGFRSELVVGAFSHLSDPLFVHDLSVEVGVSPFEKQTGGAAFHFRGSYEFMRTYRLELEHNSPSFYDLFNERKVGTQGTKVGLGHTYYWKFDQPHRITQTSDLTFFTGIETINDNLIRVNFPDFFIFETKTNSRNVRRAIGGVDSEAGDEWDVSLLGLGTRFGDPQAAVGMYAVWSHYQTLAWPHNVLHLKLLAGYLHNPEDLAIGKFYFGGFGNQYLEDDPVQQYREAFRFPGVPIYTLVGGRFAKIMLEQNLPPWRFGNLQLAQQMLTQVDAALFTQGLFLNSGRHDQWINLGGQLNLKFKHWFNLESTLSVGTAKAWSQGVSSDEWFISLKLLRD